MSGSESGSNNANFQNGNIDPSSLNDFLASTDGSRYAGTGMNLNSGGMFKQDASSNDPLGGGWIYTSDDIHSGGDATGMIRAYQAWLARQNKTTADRDAYAAAIQNQPGRQATINVDPGNARVLGQGGSQPTILG